MPTENCSRYCYEPDYAVAPGETLRETIDALGMDQRELAVRTELTPKTINWIIQGKAPLTQETALKMEHATGVPARIWNNLEMNYREQLARIEECQQLVADIEWLKKIPTSDLIRRGAIQDQPDKPSLLREVLSFFGTATVQSWNNLWQCPQAAFRRSKIFESKPEATAAWLRLGELEAQKIQCQPYDQKKFKVVLQDIRKMTTLSPKKFVPKMQCLCAEAGVAVVFVREIKGAPVCGVSRWLTPQKALIQLSLRYKRNDHFWFSFFHEAGHILHGGKKKVYIHGDGQTGRDEDQANKFAQDTLIPPERATEIPRLKSEAEVKAFANSVGVAPGIVAGRFQRETGKYDYFHNLQLRFEWSDN